MRPRRHRPPRQGRHHSARPTAASPPLIGLLRSRRRCFAAARCRSSASSNLADAAGDPCRPIGRVSPSTWSTASYGDRAHARRTPRDSWSLALTALQGRSHVASPLLIVPRRQRRALHRSTRATQIVAAMQAKGHAPSPMSSTPDEDTVFHKPSNRLSYIAIAEAFFARHLGGAREPAGRLRGFQSPGPCRWGDARLTGLVHWAHAGKNRHNRRTCRPLRPPPRCRRTQCSAGSADR